MRLYLDDADATNNVASAPGDTIFFSSNDYYVPYYDEMIEGTDFITDYDAGFITVMRVLDRRATLAVSYTRRDGTPFVRQIIPRKLICPETIRSILS
jgi:hypothetical protein